MLSSVDGKISSGDNDELDPDRDWKRIRGVYEGLHQYYEIERTTDLYSLNSGRVMAKIGVNTRPAPCDRSPASFVIIDNQPHLSRAGVEYMAQWGQKLILITTNPKHPAQKIQSDRVQILQLEAPLNLSNLFERLRRDFGIERITVQSGGELNCALLRAGLIDRVSLVLAPLLVGGRTTPTIIDGEALHSIEELGELRPLRLLKCKELLNSYVYLEYEVIADTVLELAENN